MTRSTQFIMMLALLAGDALIVMAYRVMLQAGTQHAERLVSLMDNLTQGVGLPDGIVAQTHKVMDNLKRALAGCGSGLHEVVAARCFLTEFERDYAIFNDVYKSYFPSDKLPARTTVGVTGLARGGIVEIDFIARRS